MSNVSLCYFWECEDTKSLHTTKNNVLFLFKENEDNDIDFKIEELHSQLVGLQTNK